MWRQSLLLIALILLPAVPVTGEFVAALDLHITYRDAGATQLHGRVLFITTHDLQIHSIRHVSDVAGIARSRLADTYLIASSAEQNPEGELGVLTITEYDPRMQRVVTEYRHSRSPIRLFLPYTFHLEGRRLVQMGENGVVWILTASLEEEERVQYVDMIEWSTRRQIGSYRVPRNAFNATFVYPLNDGDSLVTQHANGRTRVFILTSTGSVKGDHVDVPFPPHFPVSFAIVEKEYILLVSERGYIARVTYDKDSGDLAVLPAVSVFGPHSLEEPRGIRAFIPGSEPDATYLGIGLREGVADTILKVSLEHMEVIERLQLEEPAGLFARVGTGYLAVSALDGQLLEMDADFQIVRRSGALVNLKEILPFNGQ